MNYWPLLLSFAYVVFGLAVVRFEFFRTRARGVDTVTLFMVVFLLQCCAAGVVIYGLLPFVDPNNPTGVYAFNRILGGADATTALLVLVLTCWFAVSFYAGCAIGRRVLPSVDPGAGVGIGQSTLTISNARLFAVLVFGMALTLYSFSLLGDSLFDRYAQLILFRGIGGEVERNALNANAFALTQTWSWLAVLAIFGAWELRRRRWLMPVVIGMLVVFAILGVSRRALFLPVVMIYLAVVLHTGRWHVRWILLAAVPITIVLAFGKTAFSTITDQRTLADSLFSYDSWATALLRAGADVGITIVESLGTLQFLDEAPRLGADHLLSIIKIFPEQTLGFTFDFPERVVRVSTAAFDGPNAQDIPPGLMGQMWLDFRMVGPIIWGLVFGLQISVVQFFYERTRRSRASAAVFVLLVFVVALPLNTGSFDFTFSVDIVALMLLLLLCIRMQKTILRGRLISARQVALHT